jgi:lipoate-protein ligase B
MSRSIHVARLPLTPYADAWRWQLEAAAAVRAGGDERMALLQHPAVYTLGRRLRPEHLLVPPEVLRARGAAVVQTNRGGDVTFHGPGQLVAYPILDVRSRGLGPVEYVRLLEATILHTLARFGIEAFCVRGRPGVWTAVGKIAAIGVRIEGGVSLHGFALNVETDLAWFDAIVPCGIADAGVTSMQAVLGASPGLPAVADAVTQELAAVFESTLVDDLPALNAVRLREAAHAR